MEEKLSLQRSVGEPVRTLISFPGPLSLESFLPPGDLWQMCFELRAEGQRARPLSSGLVPVFSAAAGGDAYQPSKASCWESLLGAYRHGEICLL